MPLSRVVVAAVTLLSALTLTSCAALPDRVHDALDSAASAASSAALALDLRDRDRALPPLTDTVLGDALTELDDATTDLTDGGASGDGSDSELRQQALDAIRTASDAVLAARDAVARGDDLDASLGAVRDAGDRLTVLSDGIGS